MSKRPGSTVVEVKGSHAIYVSQPGAVVAPIEQAAEGVKAAGDRPPALNPHLDENAQARGCASPS
jgi:hypothetical protein